MKKGQVLAALALAFALGVVAPVAGVAESANAFTVATSSTYGKANCDEVADFIAGLKADSPIYALEATAFDLAAKYTANPVVLNNEGYNIEFLAQTVVRLNPAILSYTSVAGLGTTNNTPAQIRTAIANARNLSVAISKDGQTISVNAYNMWNNIFEGIEAVEKGEGTSKLATALMQAYNDTKDPAFNYATQGNLNQYVSMTRNPLLSGSQSGAFTAFLNLRNSVKAAVDALAKYDAAIAELDAAVTANDKQILTAAGRTQYDNIVNQTAPAYAKVADYVYLINDGNKPAANDWIKDRAVWYNVYNKVTTLNTNACNKTDEANYTDMMAASTAYIAATWDKFVGKDDYEVAQYLMGIKPAVIPGEDDNKPTTPDDGKGEDNTDKVGTPNDGALAKAEGSTSASASIMAAIATALTAAGAAFIAIRRKIAAKKEA